MSKVNIYKKLPKAVEYNELRKDASWSLPPIEAVEKFLPKSLYGVSVYDDQTIIGMGRVVGDGGICFYIQDVIVKKEFQRQGIGRKIMEMLMQYINESAVHNSSIGLMSSKGKEGFYTLFGFEQRPNEKFGSGMSQFVRKEQKQI